MLLPSLAICAVFISGETSYSVLERICHASLFRRLIRLLRVFMGLNDVWREGRLKERSKLLMVSDELTPHKNRLKHSFATTNAGI
jgi:hypothetical protein